MPARRLKNLSHRLFDKHATQLPLPFVLVRKRLYILPTKEGFFFVVILAGMLLGSVNYNNNLAFLLTFLLASMTFVAMLHTYRNLLGLEILSVSAAPVFCGESAVFRVGVRSHAHRKATDWELLAADDATGEDGETVRRDLLNEGDLWIDVPLPATARGYLQPDVLIIASRYPLGLFRTWTRLHFRMKCLVYPKPEYGLLEMSGGESGDEAESGSEAAPGVDDFVGLSAYQPGDPLQHISWKAFSKGQGVLTKSFSGQSGASVYIDWNALETTDTERRISLLCGMVLKADRLGMSYGLMLPRQTIDIGKGEGHKHRCLKALALFGPADTVGDG